VSSELANNLTPCRVVRQAIDCGTVLEQCRLRLAALMAEWVGVEGVPVAALVTAHSTCRYECVFCHSVGGVYKGLVYLTV
jgi:hypothetical protein